MDEKDFDKLVKDAQNTVDDIQNDTRTKRRMIQAWWAKFNEQLDKRRNLILFAIILAVIGAYINPTLPTVTANNPIIEKVKSVSLEDVSSAFQEKEVPQGNMYCVDLDKMNQVGTSVSILKDAEGKEVGKRFIVKRNLIDDVTKVSQFVTLKEPVNNLKYNKIHYPKYLEEQSLLEAKEVK